MREIPIAKARDELTSLPEQLAEKLTTVAVTRRGKPVLAVMPWELYESVIETLEIMGDQELIASLRQSIQEVAEGKTIPWEQVKKELNLDVPDRIHPSSAKDAQEHFRSASAGENSGTNKRTHARTRKKR
ncbi:MAG: type II toxin-antitoxin system Phd/YefM family antitoxin [Acidobacteriota bacterium]